MRMHWKGEGSQLANLVVVWCSIEFVTLVYLDEVVFRFRFKWICSSRFPGQSEIVTQEV
jgi:hypothetical protein